MISVCFLPTSQITASPAFYLHTCTCLPLPLSLPWLLQVDWRYEHCWQPAWRGVRVRALGRGVLVRLVRFVLRARVRFTWRAGTTAAGVARARAARLLHSSAACRLPCTTSAGLLLFGMTFPVDIAISIFSGMTFPG